MDFNKALILGIESSCDDTAASVLEISSKGPEIKSSIVHNQFNLHKEYGGVVPEIAARAHAELIDVVVEKALKSAKVVMADISAIGVTAGPGLNFAFKVFCPGSPLIQCIGSTLALSFSKSLGS